MANQPRIDVKQHVADLAHLISMGSEAEYQHEIIQSILELITKGKPCHARTEFMIMTLLDLCAAWSLVHEYNKEELAGMLSPKGDSNG